MVQSVDSSSGDVTILCDDGRTKRVQESDVEVIIDHSAQMEVPEKIEGQQEPSKAVAVKESDSK